MSEINPEILETYFKNRLLKKHKHQYYDLYIWNYTENVQFNKLWDNITSICRGLITDVNGKIVGRSFNKFHNYEEQNIKSAKKCRIFDKVDGSLGILFFYNKEWIFSSRGSFDSPQAIKGKSMIPLELLDILDTDISYTFEIIYPENRIVIDYGLKESLVFLAAFRKDGTEIFYHNNIPIFDFFKKNGVEVIEEYTDEFPEFVNFDDLKLKNFNNKE